MKEFTPPSFPVHTAASKDVTNWWLAYWVSTFRYPGDSHMNISTYNISPIFAVTHATHYSILEHDAFPAFNVTESSSNVYFYIGIYLGLAAANSVSPQLTVCPVPALCHCLLLLLRGVLCVHVTKVLVSSSDQIDPTPFRSPLC